MATKKAGPEFRLLRRSLRGAAPLGAVPIDRAARLLDCPIATIHALIRSGDLITVKVLGEKRVPLSEIRRRRR